MTVASDKIQSALLRSVRGIDRGRTVNSPFRPIVIFGRCHEDDLIRLNATLVKSGIGNFVAGRLDEGGACEDVARAALVIISTAATSSKERRRIGRAAKRHAVPLLFLSDWKKS